MKKVKVAIIGAGSAGLSARREIAKKTDEYVVINSGKLGTTCARVGCMPSKVLIQAANDFQRRGSFEQQGIFGAEHITVDTKLVMKHVRSLRDRFVRGVLGGMEGWKENNFIAAHATFETPNILNCDGQKIEAEKIIIATGSRPIVPDEFKGFEEYLITTDEIFELEDLPKSLVVCGLGVIGLELGQACSRLGVDVLGIARRDSIGGITDPVITKYAMEKFSSEMNLSFEGVSKVEKIGNKIKVTSGSKEILAEKVLLTVGRSPNLESLNLEKIVTKLSSKGIPEYEPESFVLKEHSHIFIAGDVNGQKQILHEASDEGKIVGHNAVNSIKKYKPRCSLQINFCDPNIASAGLTYEELQSRGIDFETGKVSFEGQGRSIVKLKEVGLLHVYGDKKTGELLGAEMFGPDTEHIAHLLSWAMSERMNVNKVLSLPFYHPVIEEGLRTSLRDLQDKLGLETPNLELEG